MLVACFGWNRGIARIIQASKVVNTSVRVSFPDKLEKEKILTQTAGPVGFRSGGQTNELEQHPALIPEPIQVKFVEHLDVVSFMNVKKLLENIHIGL